MQADSQPEVDAEATKPRGADRAQQAAPLRSPQSSVLSPGKAKARRSAATGREGEEIAARYLVRHGCAILARNWRVGRGEVDIVAECPPYGQATPGDGRELVFI